MGGFIVQQIYSTYDTLYYPTTETELLGLMHTLNQPLINATWLVIYDRLEVVVYIRIRQCPLLARLWWLFIQKCDTWQNTGTTVGHSTDILISFYFTVIPFKISFYVHFNFFAKKVALTTKILSMWLNRLINYYNSDMYFDWIWFFLSQSQMICETQLLLLLFFIKLPIYLSSIFPSKYRILKIM